MLAGRIIADNAHKLRATKMPKAGWRGTVAALSAARKDDAAHCSRYEG